MIPWIGARGLRHASALRKKRPTALIRLDERVVADLKVHFRHSRRDLFADASRPLLDRSSVV